MAWVSDHEKIAILLRILGGRSGYGHHIQTSGRVDCGECHHPADHHQPDCEVGKILNDKDYAGYIERQIKAMENVLENVITLTRQPRVKRAYLPAEALTAVKKLLDQHDEELKKNMNNLVEIFKLRERLRQTEDKVRDLKKQVYFKKPRKKAKKK